jgi:hypothetical protein
MRMNEEKLINRLLPVLEKRLSNKITNRVMTMVQEEIYPPETSLKKSFVKDVLEAEKRIKEGKGKTYTYREFKEKFLSK